MKLPPQIPETESLYIFPIRTGSQNYLSGTMGELRANHFHAGLDIKTQGVQGLEVLASSGGYVSRIKVSSGGYGNALYLKHPNGTTTVYAHLQKYNETIQEYVRNAQYQKKSFEIELYPEKDQFPLNQGEVLGYSGNSGSSGGPHLHFEIRDGRQRPLNPLKHKFKEIQDNIPPQIRKVALKTMDKNSRINNQYGRFEFSVIKRGSYYTLPVPIEAAGNIAIELLAHDKLNGANNRNGVPCLELLYDGEQAFQQNLERFTFAETRSILVHTDYETAQKKGQRFVKLYIDDGNKLPFYHANASNGILKVLEGSKHQIQLNLWDNYNNSSQLIFEITGTNPAKKVELVNYQEPKKISYQLVRNDLVVKAPLSADDESCAYVYSNRMRYELNMAYSLNRTAVFLWDMDQGLPDSLVYGEDKIEFEYKAIMPGNQEFNYYGDHFDIFAPADALFDTVFLTVGHHLDTALQKEIFQIGEDIFPVKRNISITLKPTLKYINQNKTSVYSVDKMGNNGYVGGDWHQDQIKFKTRNWGTYTLLADTVNPEIRPVQLSSERLAFIIKDSLSGIDSYQLEVDGQWVLMNYDYKRNLIWSEKLDPKLPFKGHLQLKVVDNVGNIKYYRGQI